MENLDKIYEMADDFSSDMRARLKKKMIDGYTGWDDRTQWSNIAAKILPKLNRILDGTEQEKDFFDVANLVAILHYMRNNESH